MSVCIKHEQQTGKSVSDNRNLSIYPRDDTLSDDDDLDGRLWRDIEQLKNNNRSRRRRERKFHFRPPFASDDIEYFIDSQNCNDTQYQDDL